MARINAVHAPSGPIRHWPGFLREAVPNGRMGVRGATGNREPGRKGDDRDAVPPDRPLDNFFIFRAGR
jgi:hypothetical protein